MIDDKFDSSEHPIQTCNMIRITERSQKEKDFDEVFDVLMEAKVVTERALEEFEELRDKYGK